MIKLTLVEEGKPIIGIGVEYDDWRKLKDEKQTFIFEIGGQTVHVGYVESKEKLQERIIKRGLQAKITASPDAQSKPPLSERLIHVPGEEKKTLKS